MVKPAFHGSITASTLGEGNPSHLTERSNYRFKGRPGWPDDPETRDDKGIAQPLTGGAVERKAGRERRLAIYIAARARGLGVVDAGLEAGVKEKAAHRYEDDRIARLAAEQQGGESRA